MWLDFPLYHHLCCTLMRIKNEVHPFLLSPSLLTIMVYAAILSAIGLGMPTSTPPSASASITRPI